MVLFVIVMKMVVSLMKAFLNYSYSNEFDVVLVSMFDIQFLLVVEARD